MPALETVLFWLKEHGDFWEQTYAELEDNTLHIYSRIRDDIPSSRSNKGKYFCCLVLPLIVITSSTL